MIVHVVVFPRKKSMPTKRLKTEPNQYQQTKQYPSTACKRFPFGVDFLSTLFVVVVVQSLQLRL